jgi:hypothetical protein
VETTEAEAEVAAALLTTLLAWEGTDHVQTQPTAEGSALRDVSGNRCERWHPS